jgi:hypothetical protein
LRVFADAVVYVAPSYAGVVAAAAAIA